MRTAASRPNSTTHLGSLFSVRAKFASYHRGIFLPNVISLGRAKHLFPDRLHKTVCLYSLAPHETRAKDVLAVLHANGTDQEHRVCPRVHGD